MVKFVEWRVGLWAKQLEEGGEWWRRWLCVAFGQQCSGVTMAMGERRWSSMGRIRQGRHPAHVSFSPRPAFPPLVLPPSHPQAEGLMGLSDFLVDLDTNGPQTPYNATKRALQGLTCAAQPFRVRQ